MKFKLPLMSRIPLVIRRGNGMLYFNMQYEVLRKPDISPESYLELYRMENTSEERKIGNQIIYLLRRFQEHPEWDIEEVNKATGMDWKSYVESKSNQVYKFMGISSKKERDLNFSMLIIKYAIDTNTYSFGFHYPYFEGSKYYMDGRNSTGKPGLLTFDTPLEFDSSISPEELGRMTLEAFDRCQQLRDAAAGNKFPKKQLTLLDESVLEVQMPRDKHFSDSEDMGVGELYQVYEYFPKEDADSCAHFCLGIGAELNCDLSEENILAAWENYHGKAEHFAVQEVKHGIYSLRAELRNKNVHKVSYFMPQNEALLLECTMELFQPGKRKKLDEKLMQLFEEFVEKCKKQNI